MSTELFLSALFVSFAGQFWLDCSHQRLAMPWSTGATSAQRWTSSGKTWACVLSTMCSLTSECFQLFWQVLPQTTGKMFDVSLCSSKSHPPRKRGIYKTLSNWSFPSSQMWNFSSNFTSVSLLQTDSGGAPLVLCPAEANPRQQHQGWDGQVMQKFFLP